MKLHNFLHSYAMKQYLYSMRKKKPLELESTIFGLIAQLAWNEPDKAFEMYSQWPHKHEEWSLEGELEELKRDGVDYTKKTKKEYDNTEILENYIVYYMVWYSILLNMTGIMYDPKKNILKWRDPDGTDADMTLPTPVDVISASNLKLILRIITKSSIYNWFFRFCYRLRMRICIFDSVKITIKKIVSKEFRKKWEEEEKELEESGMTSKEVIDAFDDSNDIDEKLVMIVLDGMEIKESEDEEHSLGFWAFVRLCERHDWLNNRVDWINGGY